MPSKTKKTARTNKRSVKAKKEEGEVVEQDSEQVAAKQTKQSTKKVAKKATKDNTEEEASNNTDRDSSSDDNQDRSRFEQTFDEMLEVRQQIVNLQRREKVLLKKLHNNHRSEVKKANNRKRKANTKPTGFAVGKQIGGKLADWLNVDRGTVMTGPELSAAFWARIKEEGLQSKDNGRVFRTNSEVSKIFGVPKSVNKINDPKDEKGFNMRTYQTHIKHALTHHNE